MLLTVKPYKTDLTADDIVSIRIARKLGIGIRHIARVTGRSRTTIHNITSERHHVTVVSTTLSIYEDA